MSRHRQRDDSERERADVPLLLRAAFEAHQVDSPRVREKVLTATWVLASGGQPATEPTPPTAPPRPRERRVPGLRTRWRPTLPTSARPRLVTIGALAAVVGVIGASVALASVGRGGSPAAVAGSSVNPGPPGTPAPTLAAAGTTPTSSATATAPAVTARPDDPTGAGQPSDVGSGDAVQATQVTGFPAGGQLVLPQPGTQDWVVFGPGYDGVVARSGTLLIPKIETNQLANVGSVVRYTSTSVSWTLGMLPWAQVSGYTERLRVPGGQAATLTVLRAASTGNFSLYLGAASGLRITVTSPGLQPSTIAVPPRSAAEVINLDLSGVSFLSSATLTLTGADGTPFTMIAAVLR